MKKQFRLLAVVLTILLVLQGITVFSAQAAVFNLKLSSKEVVVGKEITVKVAASNVSDVAALFCRLKYDANKVSLKSSNVKNSVFNGISVYNNESSATVSCAWESTDNVGVKRGTVFSLTFIVKENAPLGDSDISFEISELFSASYHNVPFTITGDKRFTVIGNSIPQAVFDTIAKIDAIGTVDTSAECFARINDALSMYNALSGDNKALVTNSKTLEDAIRTYYDLKFREEEAQNAAANAKIIQDFKNRDILKKNISEISLKDEIPVLDAISYHNQQSAYIRSQLQAEYKLLMSFKSRIEEIKAETEDRETAKEQVASFRAVYRSLINLPVGNMILEEKILGNIEDALRVYDLINDYAKAELKPEYKHILELKKRYEELEILNAPESEAIIKAANEFKEKYRRILNLNQSEITDSDVAEISEAINELKGFSNELRGKLINEFEILNSFLLLLNNGGRNNLFDGKTILSTDNPSDGTVEKVVETKTVEGKAKTVYVDKNAGINKNILNLILILLVSVAALLGSVFVYSSIKRKELFINGEGTQK